MIVRAWYSALGLELDNYPGLVHYPENYRYILDINNYKFSVEYCSLLNRLEYLSKYDTKVFGGRGGTSVVADSFKKRSGLMVLTIRPLLHNKLAKIH